MDHCAAIRTQSMDIRTAILALHNRGDPDMNARMARETESEGRRCSKVPRWALVVACALLLGALIGFCLLLVFDAA